MVYEMSKWKNRAGSKALRLTFAFVSSSLPGSPNPSKASHEEDEEIVGVVSKLRG
jgi:hypothetical protein